MSSILNALNKSEAERQRAQPPGWNSPMQFGSQPPPPRRRRWWWLVLVAVVALALAWLFGVFSPNPELAGLPQTAATSDGLEGSGGDDPGVVQPGAVATGPEIAFGQPSRTTDSPGSLDLAGSDRIPDAVRRLREQQAQARAETDPGTQMDRLRQLAQLRRGEISRAELGSAAARRPVTAEQTARAEQEIRMLAEALGEDPDEITDDMIEEMAIAMMAAEESERTVTQAAGADAGGGGAPDPGASLAVPQRSGRPAVSDAPQVASAPAPAPTAPPARVIGTSPPAAEQAIGAGDLPVINELPFATRSALPAMTLTMHLYSDDPARRMVLLNGARAADGDELDNGLRILAIRPDGVAIEFQGTRFLLPARP